MDLIEQAVDDWRRQLVDLTGRNRLITYRPLKAGTLDLADADDSAIQKVMAGKIARLSDLFDEDSDNFDDALKRSRAVAKTGRTNLEERGIGTLFLASGTATWDPGETTSAKPNAPLFLAPLQVRAIGGSQRDFEFELIDDWSLNKTLLIYWAEVFDINIDQSVIEDSLATTTGHSGAATALQVQLRGTGSLPSLRIDEALFCGNFSYTKMPMVVDIQENIALLAANSLIAAIAGDSDAAVKVRATNSAGLPSLDAPDHIPPELEFLFLDADSSQSHVINSALSGRSLVVQGPPGTGKSQTIANLIGHLAAQGKSVLFVAEKRAAIEAVAKRIDKASLSDIVLDLHTSVLRKKDTARALASSLDAIAAATPSRTGSRESKLANDRQRLIDYSRELHVKRGPWDISSFDINNELLSFPADSPKIAMESDLIQTLTDDKVVEIQEDIDRWVSTRRHIDWGSPWLNVSIASQDAADKLSALSQSLHAGPMTRLADAVEVIDDQLGFSIAGWPVARIAKLCRRSLALSAVSDRLNTDVWVNDTIALRSAMAKKRRFGQAGRDYRQAVEAYDSISTKPLGRKEQLAALDQANKLSQSWHEAAGPIQPQRIGVASAVGQDLEKLSEMAAFGPTLAPNVQLSSLPELSALLEALNASLPMAILTMQLRSDRQALTNIGCSNLVEAVERGDLPEGDAAEAFAFGAIEGIKSQIDTRVRELNSFASIDQNQTVQRFIAGDKAHLETASQRIMRSVAENAVAVRNAFPEQGNLIEREANKKTRHRSLRQLQTEAGDVLKALRPCWMMSPLMVAQALPAERIFDYVIFDEASQIRPAEAISAISRGKNLIVAGDRHQLPPSAFFASNVDEDEAGDEVDDSLTSGYESILDVMSALLPFRSLNWHYRSTDDRLIKLSNEAIYGGSLITFPAPRTRSPISFHKVDHHPIDKVEIRSNRTEVAKVVKLMIEHANQRPDETLGVIAFGQHHATAIEDALREELASLATRSLDEFFSEEKEDRVFVKNIERVQGDERDAIILSIGYGKDLTGKVPHRFGPVNQEGGERRINVAASRSRRRMLIVSSILASDLSTEGLGAGPQLLERMLRFAQTGGEDTGEPAIEHPLNPFELAVKFELDQLGLDPICQYGVGSYRIDFVLPHPDADGRMVLAVEADGASYHSSPTARDRDRLRQQVLEGLGWKFCRIWSTAFFKDPESEALRVKEAFDHALAGTTAAYIDLDDYLPPIERMQTTGKATKPYLATGTPVDQHDHLLLVALVRWITQDGDRLMTEDQIKAQMKDELGYVRMGARIDAAFDKAIRAV